MLAWWPGLLYLSGMKPGRTLLAVFMAFVTVLASPPALADPRDDKKRIDAEVAKASALLEAATDRARQAARLFAEANESLPGAELRVAEARGRVAGTKIAFEEAQRVVAAAQVELDRANAELAAAGQRVTTAERELGHFVAASYKGGGIATLNVVFEARTPADLASRLGYLERVVDNQRSALDALRAARLDAKLASNVAVVAKRRAEEARLAAERALAAAREEQAAAERAAAEVVALTAQRKDALGVAAEEKAATLARYEEVKAESARIAVALQEWEARRRRQGAAPGPILRPGARLLMPVRGWKSSDFGMRFDPFYGVWQLHAGVDIAADGGQPIYAAADGKVIQAGWNGGYGNYTCLYHGTSAGRSLATCYAHQSAIMVDEGQRVRRGDLIGRVGTTGASTGNHLHFEVRVGGGPVEPLEWLPGCLC